MEIRPLCDIELRDALGPVNRAAGGRTAPGMLPLVHTAAQLRERAALGVLDLKLSRALLLSGGIAGACLVERVGERAHLDAFGVDPLAQQRGGGKALCEAVVAAAAAAEVRCLTAFGSDFDAQLLPILQAAGFERRREVARYTLSLSGPTQALIPDDIGEAPYDTAAGQTVARVVPLGEALAVLEPLLPEQPSFLQLPDVLRRLGPKLTAVVMQSPTGILAAGVADRERRQLLTLGGQNETAVAELAALLAARYGVHFIDALGVYDPVTPALTAAGFQRASLRTEFQKLLQSP